ncbi:MAG: DUF4157 domain-containing protein [bacterium]|nr:DUF4157 domain-containing protein [bacterium]
MSYSGYLEQQAAPAASFTPAAGYGPQAKLKVSQPGDALEQEADQMAERVVNGGGSGGASAPTPASHGVQRQCDDCAAGEKKDQDRRGPETVQRQADDEGEAPEQDDDTGTVSAKLMPSAGVIHRTEERDSRDTEKDEEKIDSLSAKLGGGAGGGVVAAPVAAQIRGVQNSGGQPLAGGVRRSMEPHFRRSLKNVRVHTDPKAASTAGAIKARAYTIGRDVVFNQGEYSPETIEGKRLLAHELTHVVQQGGA